MLSRPALISSRMQTRRLQDTLVISIHLRYVALQAAAAVAGSGASSPVLHGCNRSAC